MAQDELTAWFDEHRSCPDCGGNEFQEGPRGGLSQNVRCSNMVCSAEFNLTFFQGKLLFVDRIKWDHPPARKAH